ncbi:MAG: hypothetical protein Q4D54_07080 [Eubacteriales bacterium]|nr:hypothetical protein [Eubacteriales bacterium]
MAALDYTFERREKLFRAEEREQGRQEGRAEGLAEGIVTIANEYAPNYDVEAITKRYMKL